MLAACFMFGPGGYREGGNWLAGQPSPFREAKLEK